MSRVSSYYTQLLDFLNTYFVKWIFLQLHGEYFGYFVEFSLFFLNLNRMTTSMMQNSLRVIFFYDLFLTQCYQDDCSWWTRSVGIFRVGCLPPGFSRTENFKMLGKRKDTVLLILYYIILLSFHPILKIMAFSFEACFLSEYWRYSSCCQLSRFVDCSWRRTGLMWFVSCSCTNPPLTPLFCPSPLLIAVLQVHVTPSMMLETELYMVRVTLLHFPWQFKGFTTSQRDAAAVFSSQVSRSTPDCGVYRASFLSPRSRTLRSNGYSKLAASSREAGGNRRFNE